MSARFCKYKGEWVVQGRPDEVLAKRPVTVRKADGSRVQVIVISVSQVFTNGLLTAHQKPSQSSTYIMA